MPALEPSELTTAGQTTKDLLVKEDKGDRYGYLRKAKSMNSTERKGKKLTYFKGGKLLLGIL